MSNRAILSFKVDGKTFKARGGFNYKPGKFFTPLGLTSPLMLKFKISAAIERLRQRIARYCGLIKKVGDPRLVRHYRFCIFKARNNLASLLVRFNRI